MANTYELTTTLPGKVDFHLTTEQDSNQLLRLLLDAGVRIQAFEEILPSLNDVFIRQVTTLGKTPESN
ncbi:MAG: DUF4162 domain-containing protein [Bacteroidota bacterium]